MPTDPRGIGDVDEPCEVDAKLAGLLKILGFESGAPIYRAIPYEPFERVFRDLVEGFCQGGKSPFRGRCDGLLCDVVDLTWLCRDKRYGPFQVEILTDLLQAVHKHHRMAPDGPMVTGEYRPAYTDYPSPDWYIRGTVLSPRRDDPGEPRRRFHGYIQSETGEKPHTWPHGMVVQIATPSGTNQSGPLIWGTGLPGGPSMTHYRVKAK